MVSPETTESPKELSIIKNHRRSVGYYHILYIIPVPHNRR